MLDWDVDVIVDVDGSFSWRLLNQYLVLFTYDLRQYPQSFQGHPVVGKIVIFGLAELVAKKRNESIEKSSLRWHVD